MKTGDDHVGSSLRQRIANANGKMSTQFMSGDLRTENPARKKALEDSVKMAGYDVCVKKPSKAKFDMKQPMAGYSEFWYG